MTLALYGHPFSSYTWKALIALWENQTPFDFKLIDQAEPENLAAWNRHWPMQRFPLLVDGDRSVAETSIIVEYLQLAHPGPVQLIPADPMAALDVRFLDRFFDLHVMNCTQIAVDAKLGRLGTPEQGLSVAAAKLDLAYDWLEGHLNGKTWAAGEVFTLADCAAAPSLFYADWTHQIPAKYEAVRAYRARLLARPSIARAIDGGRPFRHYFPLGAPDRD